MLSRRSLLAGLITAPFVRASVTWSHPEPWVFVEGQVSWHEQEIFLNA